MQVPTTPLKPGLVNLPGATPDSKALVAELLRKNFTDHHCFFNDKQFISHLSHHILSLHDLGAPAEWIQDVYRQEAVKQKPLFPNGAPADKTIEINQSNWTKSLGKKYAHMYPHYLAFFMAEINKDGVAGVLERYVFSAEANEKGALMLTRFVGRVLHPLIDVGFGIEFGQDYIVAQGLAQAVLTEPDASSVMDLPTGMPVIKSGPATTLLALLREGYEAAQLAPMPYEPGPLTPDRFVEWMHADPECGAAIRDIYAKWTFNIEDGEDFALKVEECMWQATLLLGATSKAGRKPRMDFFFMHLLTASLALRAVVDAIRAPVHKAQLLQAYVRTAALYVVLRGRPCIDPALVMSYSASPAPPKSPAGHGSPWLAILNNAALHSEAHAVKSIRALFYCAQQYGGTPPGAVVGAVDEDGKETHKGAVQLDGTLFVRVAGKLTNALGWVVDGDAEQFWDNSGVGWEEAWAQEDK
ncbi:hypothetical protein C8R46DRAFT_1296168 [Mycena filopes]|nr:hypothetical protein C8R46DRAFT_1296168 [Mycena filopes]